MILLSKKRVQIKSALFVTIFLRKLVLE